MKIKIARLSINDLRATPNYISQDKPDVAVKVMQRVIEAIEHITTFPSIGRTGRVPHTKN